jgi:hypothetical protein
VEDLPELLGWLALSGFGVILVTGLLLRFVNLKRYRKTGSFLHKAATVLTCLAVTLHFLVVEERSVLLIVSGVLFILLPSFTILLKGLRKLKFANNAKLVIVPLLMLGLLVGHALHSEKEPEHFEMEFLD